MSDSIPLDEALEVGKAFSDACDEVRDSLIEMVLIYQDTDRVSDPFPYDGQPYCIRRAYDALKTLAEADKTVLAFALEEMKEEL